MEREGGVLTIALYESGVKFTSSCEKDFSFGLICGIISKTEEAFHQGLGSVFYNEFKG